MAGPAAGGGHGRRRRHGAANGLGGPGGAGRAGVGGEGVEGRAAGRPAEGEGGEAAMTVPLRCVADDGPGRGEGPDPGDGLPHHRLRPQRAGRGKRGRVRGASASPGRRSSGWDPLSVAVFFPAGPQSDHQTARRAAGRHVRVVQGAPRQGTAGERRRSELWLVAISAAEGEELF